MAVLPVPLLLLVQLLLVLPILVPADPDYCSEHYCGKDRHHIGCGHTRQFHSRCSEKAQVIDMNGTLSEFIVRWHNRQRDYVASGEQAGLDAACRMATIQWDEELAYLAELNARECRLLHDYCHNTDAFSNTGQNLGLVGSTQPLNHKNAVETVLKSWYAEVEHSRRELIQSLPRGYHAANIGHFTVLIAERNVRVGCAASVYRGTGHHFNHFLMVCNYATTNLVGTPVYESCSKSGEHCQTGLNPVYAHLCGTEEYYKLN